MPEWSELPVMYVHCIIVCISVLLVLFTNPFKCGLCLQRKMSHPLLSPFLSLILHPPLLLMAHTPLRLHLLSMATQLLFPLQQMTPPLVDLPSTDTSTASPIAAETNNNKQQVDLLYDIPPGKHINIYIIDIT